MPRRKQLQTNFSAGELAPALAGRQDTDQYQNGAGSLLNRRPLIGGGTKRRPGSWREDFLTGASRVEAFVVDNDTQYVLAFGDGIMTAYVIDVATGDMTAAGTLSGKKWTGDIFREMDYEQSANTAFVMHADMPTQIITRTGAATWAAVDYSFIISGPRHEQPYFNVAGNNRTLAPSALTGTITLTISGSTAWFVANHIGQIVRYLGRETLVTAVAVDGLSATANVLERLPGTWSLTVTSSANFTVGEAVEGVTSGAKGFISAIADATHLTVYLSGSLIPFAAETIAGPQASTAISASAAATAAAVTDWDEALFSPVHGYPACAALHRNRILFAGHPAVPNALLGSRLNNIYSFDLDDGSDGDAIFETIGDAGAAVIVQLHSAEQLLVLTDHGPYYVPESAASPFRPSSIAFFPFGSPWNITPTAKARAFDDGVLFVSGSLVIKARPTGNLSQAWGADEVSLLSSHLVSNPERLAIVSNFDGGPERYAVLQNDDGTLAVLQLVESQKIRNMVPWTTTGDYTSVTAIGAYLYAATERTLDGNLLHFIELFDQDVTLDLTIEYATQAAMDAGVPSDYGSTTVNVVTSALTYHLGEYPPALASLPAGPYHVGLFYDSEVEILPPAIDDDEGSHTGELMRICQAYVRVRESARFEANGNALSAYSVLDDVSAAPPRKNGWQQFDFLGWSIDPVVTIDQPDPLPLEILAVKTVVAY